MGEEQPWLWLGGPGKEASMESCEGIRPGKSCWRLDSYIPLVTGSLLLKIALLLLSTCGKAHLYVEQKSVSLLLSLQLKFSSVRWVTASQLPLTPTAPWRCDSSDSPALSLPHPAAYRNPSPLIYSSLDICLYSL